MNTPTKSLDGPSRCDCVKENCSTSTQIQLSNALLQSSNDKYLHNPPLQPKQAIADYVEHNGFKVPIRFATLKEALSYINNGGDLIIRSEHPNEYSGISGLLKSYTVNKSILHCATEFVQKYGAIVDHDKLINSCNLQTIWDNEYKILSQLPMISEEELRNLLVLLANGSIQQYCSLTSYDQTDFMNNASYSYWQKIPGYNRVIIADSAIKGRYHLFSSRKDKELKANYLIIENGIIINTFGNQLGEETLLNTNRVIEFYEGIRHLGNFDPNHCPIVEFQTDFDNENHFLQYHRTINKQLPEFQIDRECQKDEIQATFVRGTTPLDGIQIDVTMFYNQYKLSETEDGSFDFHNFNIFSEIMSRKRKANIDNRQVENIALSCQDFHLPKSRIFNAPLYVCIPNDEKLLKLIDESFKKRKQTKENITIPMHIISDGKKAYISY